MWSRRAMPSVDSTRGSTRRGPSPARTPHAAPRRHSTSPAPRASRSASRGASNKCQAHTRSSAGSAGPNHPASSTPTRRPSCTSRFHGVRSLWVITSCPPSGRSRNRAHIAWSGRASMSGSTGARQSRIQTSWSRRSPPRPRPRKPRPRVGAARIARMSSARSSASPSDAATLVGVATSPSSQVCEDVEHDS